MRIALSILLLFVFSFSFAGKSDTANLRKAVLKLNVSLIEKDSAALKKLLHKKLSYGHSNGWIESKRDVIADLYNGKIVYKKIEQGEMKMVEEENICTVRSEISAEGALDGKDFQLRLHVLQMWVKSKKGWLLLSRQSVKL